MSEKAFKTVPSNVSNNVFIWRLEDWAVKDGVKSTTRDRKRRQGKSSTGSKNPCPKGSSVQQG